MSETIEQPATAIAVLGERAIVATDVFKTGGVRVILDQIRAEVAKEPIDVSTPAGRAHCRSLAAKIARSKTALDTMGKTLTDQWRLQAEEVHKERRLIEKELDALRDAVRAPLTQYEEREKKRVQAHEDALQELRLLFQPGGLTVAEIDARLAQASTLVTTRTWEEFQQRASDAFAQVNDGLNDLRAAVGREEKEKAEAARLQAEREERDRLQAIQEQQAREARIAAEAAERARREAGELAERQAAEAARAAERDRQAAIAATQAEERRKAAQERGEAEAALQAKYEAERKARYAEYEASVKKQSAEAAAAAASAERQRIDEQVVAERKAAAAREADKKHHAAVNRKARDAIEMVIIQDDRQNTQEMATAIVTAIAKREIPGVKLEY